MDRGAWQSTVSGIAKSWAWLTEWLSLRDRGLLLRVLSEFTKINLFSDSSSQAQENFTSSPVGREDRLSELRFLYAYNLRFYLYVLHIAFDPQNSGFHSLKAFPSAALFVLCISKSISEWKANSFFFFLLHFCYNHPALSGLVYNTLTGTWMQARSMLTISKYYPTPKITDCFRLLCCQ